jgi:hypothetical protein
LRLWITTKETDSVFFSLMLACFFLFTAEIMINSVVIDDFKYSFFFYLDIIATLSIVFDIPYLLYPFNALFGIPNQPDELNAIPGVMNTESIA